jgi:hypothetical protein
MSHDVTLEPSDVRRIKVDAEHMTIRLMVPVLMIVAAVMAHLLGLLLFDDLLSEAGINPLCALLPVDFLALLGAGYGVETMLKRYMPSRRFASLSADELVLTDGRRHPPQVTRIDWHKTVNVQAWRFRIWQRTHVPKGWYCLAAQLLQDESEIIIYTFMAPEEAELLPGIRHFVRLLRRKEIGTLSDLRIAAEQRRLLKLEDARWEDGAEVNKEDFKAVLACVPGWG